MYRGYNQTLIRFLLRATPMSVVVHIDTKKNIAVTKDNIHMIH